MTCQSALELLLDAEPGEFSATAPTPLGEHLRGCSRCRRVAAQLMQDTQRLALAMAAAPVGRHAVRVRPSQLIPALGMAALAAVVVWRARSAEWPVVLDAPPAVQPPLVATASAEPVPNVPVMEEARSGLKPVTRRAFARAVPLAPVRLDPAPSPARQLSVETSGVTVTPAPGTRATVMHTSNPKLLVVWLY